MLEFYSRTIVNVDSHFITEIFFLTSYAYWIDLSAIVFSYSNLKNAMEDAISQNDNHNNSETILNEIEKTKPLETIMQYLLYNPVHQQRSIAFLRFLTNWLLKLVDGNHQHPENTLTLPLQKEIPIEWLVLPEFLIEIIPDRLLNIMK